MGGLTKEWFLLLVREIFDSNYGMFVYHPHSHCYWFSVDNKEGNLREYNLIGVLMGLAVYNSNILDLHFPSVCYRKLLTPPVVPNAGNRIGVIASPTLDDLNEIMPVSNDVPIISTTKIRNATEIASNIYEFYALFVGRRSRFKGITGVRWKRGRRYGDEFSGIRMIYITRLYIVHRN